MDPPFERVKPHFTALNQNCGGGNTNKNINLFLSQNPFINAKNTRKVKKKRALMMLI
jgi:peptidase E